ncbi:MAG TPA: nucleotidyltransferase domain-containing protein, partial [Acidocella sp.]|nr:nucleotidyltransferase domain-containing protein [Acidocella sp.]
MKTMRTDETITLFRPVGPVELELIRQSGFRAFPPRLPEQPIFYPVLTEDYAVKIARDWNVPASGAGYVTRFAVLASYLAAYQPQDAGGGYAGVQCRDYRRNRDRRDIPWAGRCMMDLIMEIRFGSHLYGTATPQSDLDFKAVYIPDARDILLQRVRDNIGISPDKEPGARNSPGDVDREIFSLQRYLSLLAEGQTMALDMLFAPDSAMTMAPAPLWRDVQMNAHRLVTRRASAFLRYCRQQANKYGIKGSRIAVARHVLAVLESAEAAYGTTAKLAVAETEMNAFEAGAAHSAFVDLPTPSGQVVRHLEVCGKKLPFTSSIKSAREIAQRLVD